MFVREPGVIVYITSETLPPPLPPTQFGIGMYLSAKYGPYKPTFSTIRTITTNYTGLNSSIDNDIAYIIGSSSIYGLCLPGLALRKAVGIFAIDTTNNSGLQTFLSSAISNSVVTSNILKKALLFPTWLKGLPKHIGFITSAVVPSNFSLSGLPNYIGYITVGGDYYMYFHNYDNTIDATDINALSLLGSGSSYYSATLQLNEFEGLYDRTRCVVHLDTTTNDMIIWFRNANGDNYVLYLDYDSFAGGYYAYIYGDNSLPSLVRVRLWNPANTTTPVFDLTISNWTYTIDMNSVDILYVLPANENVSISLTSSGGNMQLGVTQGTTTITYDFHYSPLENGYYGFIRDKRIEMFVKGDIYSKIISGGANVISAYFETPERITTNFDFTDIRHTCGLYYNSLSSGLSQDFIATWTSSGNTVSYSSTPNTFNSRGDAVVLKQGPDIKYYGTYPLLYRDSDLLTAYTHWMEYHNYLIYYEDDTVPFWQTPTNVDYVIDYSGKLGYPFTRFIREKHTKLMYKIFGTPDLSIMSISKRATFTDFYWNTLIGDLIGYHAFRMQGNSVSGVSGTAIYLKGIIDYQYRPVYSINSPLGLSVSDHEFNLTVREQLLDSRVNSLVRDRLLNVYYLNNNLTEEVQADNSPLGEEQNARLAIRLAKILALFVERYIGEPNNQLTRGRVTSETTAFINGFLSTISNGVIDFKVICDDTNNTPADIANNKMNIRVEVRFAKTIKYVVVFERAILST